MTMTEKTAREAATSQTAKQEENQMPDTNQLTRSHPAPKKQRNRKSFFHSPIPTDDPVFIHTLCGELILRKRSVTAATKSANDSREYCEACRNLTILQDELNALDWE